MPYIKVDGVSLYYEETGKGEPIVLLHGLGADHHMFQKEVDFLKRNYRVITMDFRGHGMSSKPSHYTLNDHIHDAISLMDFLGIDRFHLLGASMGSYIAQGLAINFPERIHKLILVVAKAHGKTSSTQELIEAHWEELNGLSGEEFTNVFDKYVFHNLNAVKEEGERNAGQSIVLTPEEHEIASKALLDFDFREDLSKVTAQTLIISGKFDGLNPPKRGEEIANLIPESTFVIFEKSGHAPAVEEEEKYQSTVLDFLLDN